MLIPRQLWAAQIQLQLITEMNTTLCPGSWRARQWFITNLGFFLFFFFQVKLLLAEDARNSYLLKTPGLAHHVFALNCCLARIRHSIPDRHHIQWTLVPHPL